MEGRLGRFIDKIKGKKPEQSGVAVRIGPWPTLDELRQRSIDQQGLSEEQRKKRNENTPLWESRSGELRKILRDPDGEDLYLRKGIYPPTH